ncbi:MAG: YfcE family phosphodiesterase [Treponema sp.]
MKGIFQTDNYLICSETDATELAQKEQAVILALSDSHGKSETLKIILEEFAPQCDMIAFCGDGASDLILNLELARKNKKFGKNFPAVTAIVQGNGDDNLFPVNFSQSLMPKKKDESELFIPKIISAKVAGKNLLLTHGNSFGVYYGISNLEQYANQENSDLVLFGHTHIADRTDTATTTFINPGSCSLPRQGLPPSFALIKIPGDNEKVTCTFYEIKVSLSQGILFEPFSPVMRHW